MNKIPLLKDDFGFDFSVTAKNDIEIMSVRVTDAFGEFIPVPFPVWNKLVNEDFHPKIMEKYTGIHPQLAYEQAILIYCKQYEHTYICLN